MFIFINKLKIKDLPSFKMQVDDFEPPAKKTELTNSTENVPEDVSKSNGCRKTSESNEVNDKRTDKGKVIERFDSDSKVTCVTTFKESFDWD